MYPSWAPLPSFLHSIPAQPRLGLGFLRKKIASLRGTKCVLSVLSGSKLDHLYTQLMKAMVNAQRGAVSSPRSHSKAQKHLDLPHPNLVLRALKVVSMGPSKCTGADTASSPCHQHSRSGPPYLLDFNGPYLRTHSWAGRLGQAGLGWARLGQGGSSAPLRRVPDGRDAAATVMSNSTHPAPHNPRWSWSVQL